MPTVRKSRIADLEFDKGSFHISVIPWQRTVQVTGLRVVEQSLAITQIDTDREEEASMAGLMMVPAWRVIPLRWVRDTAGSQPSIAQGRGAAAAGCSHEPSWACPHLFGGKNQPSGAYSPDTDAMYMPLNNSCMDVTMAVEVPRLTDGIAINGGKRYGSTNSGDRSTAHC